ncbi:MAG: Tol-Pal system beta propeller repeat protein TolB [Alphaproteobacteria bacterium]
MTETLPTRPLWRRGVLLSGLMLLAVVLLAAPARAELRIDITRGQVEPVPVAIVPFQGEGGDATRIGREISQVISANLERSGLFRPIDPASFIDTATAVNSRPRFGDWRIINAQGLVHGAADLQADGTLQVEFRLWDVFAETQMEGQRFTTQPQNWRRVAHLISDKIYERLTGESGYFDTRVVYVSESGPGDARIKRLAIMDQDGANHRFLTDGSFLVLTPRFSPAAQEITYLSYENDEPRVYLLNIESGQRELLGDFPGMTFAPRFSPNGNQVIMSLATAGNSEVYTMDLRTRAVRRLTKNPAIDTSPSYSPDASQITFTSDRGGTPQIYVMDADGDDPRRISFGKGRYLTPVWSPRGDLIAFTKLTGGRAFIGVMAPDGSGERLLAEGDWVEAPTWAPNGRVLIFFKETDVDPGGLRKAVRLHSIDLTGFNERQILTPSDGSDPAWSPLIP